MIETRLDPSDAPALLPRARRGPLPLAFALVVLVAGVVVGGMLWKLRSEVPGPSPQPAAPADALRPSAAPQPDLAPSQPAPLAAFAPASPAPLPALDESDATLGDALRTLLPAGAFEALVNPERVARRIVTTVDNLPRASVAPAARVARPVPGAMLTATDAATGTATIAPDNATRYAPYVDALLAVDPRALVRAYARFYPLLDGAYRELGYPNAHFNDRLVAALDDLLAAPTATGALAVVQPRVLWQYADPDLESLSAGQKMMLRMGPAQEARVKARLAEVRALVAGERR